MLGRLYRARRCAAQWHMQCSACGAVGKHGPRQHALKCALQATTVLSYVHTHDDMCCASLPSEFSMASDDLGLWRCNWFNTRVEPALDMQGHLYCAHASSSKSGLHGRAEHWQPLLLPCCPCRVSACLLLSGVGGGLVQPASPALHTAHMQ